jgi:hypothetical protein
MRKPKKQQKPLNDLSRSLTTADMPVKEILSRDLRDRRAVAR